jgi:peptidoglycan hydrolase-like protein with peptidoglycan-binding domain
MSAARKRRIWRVITGSVTGVAVTAGVLVTGYTITAEPKSTASASEVPTRTEAVTRGTVSQRLRLAGTYAFDGSYTVLHRGAPGIVTGVRAAGAKVDRGGVLYSVGERAVHLLFGSIPAHRDLTSGLTDGADVRELERNLRALGMDPDHEMTVDTDFTWATAAAVKRLQKSWGLPYSERTGTLTLGSVVFLPGTLRVTPKVSNGAAVGPEQPVLTASSTRRVVSTSIDADMQSRIEVGDKVSVTLPGGEDTDGEILRIGKVATAGTDENGNAGTATVPVVLRISVPKGTPDLDQAPVQVKVATVVRKNVLTVPISALLARPGSGYRVKLASGVYADVEPGLYDDETNQVEISAGLKEGDRVEVPEQ